jgi:phenylpropionate dioxygenase-like ring-hydroxylating dioxygenase large terminal subunit
MESTFINTDPRYPLFQKLIDTVKNDKPQIPFETFELDVRQYIDETWFEHEKKNIFSDSPQIVGFSSMVSEPGDHFTIDYLGPPLLIVRGKDQKLRCFLNVCRHRGVRLSNSDQVSKTKTFSCEYHHWTYDLEGRLIFVPAEEGFPDFDKGCRSLKEVPLAEAYGIIWVNPNINGQIDLDSYLGNIGKDLEEFEFEEGYFFKQSIHKCKANWKLHIEAFQDGYHVTRLHNKSVGGFFKDNLAVQEREQQHIRSIVARNEIEEVLDEPAEKWNFRHHGSFSHFVWPNTTMIMHPDYTSQVTFYPIKVDETVIVHNCVIPRKPQSEKELGHFERSFKLIDEGVFANEDFHVCAQAQIGLKSGANDTFIAGGYEIGLRAFHDILKESVGPYRPL